MLCKSGSLQRIFPLLPDSPILSGQILVIIWHDRAQRLKLFLSPRSCIFCSDRRPHRGRRENTVARRSFLGHTISWPLFLRPTVRSHQSGVFFLVRMLTGITRLLTSFLCLSAVSSMRVEEQWPDLKLVINSNKLYQILGGWKSYPWKTVMSCLGFRVWESPKFDSHDLQDTLISFHF